MNQGQQVRGSAPRPPSESIPSGGEALWKPTRRSLRLSLLLGGTVAILLIGWAGAASIGREVWRAGWAMPLTLPLHAVQLLIAAHAWRRVSDAKLPGLAQWWRIRWIRESVNSLLPVVQIGGNVAGVRLLAQAGVPTPQAGAGTVLDLTAEAASQAMFTLAGIAVLAAAVADRSWAPWLAGSTVLLIAGLAGFVLAQRLGVLRLVETVAARFGGVALRGLHDETMRLTRDTRSVFVGTVQHLGAWLIGTAETWLVFYAMGALPSLAAVFAIESLGMAARSVGFAVPGALGVQETGFVLVAGLFGMPADTAIALSMVKRAREVTVGIGGLLAWQWSGPRATRTPAGRSRRESEEHAMSDLPPVLPPELPDTPPPGPGPDLPPVPEELPPAPLPGQIPGKTPPPLLT